MKYIVLECHPGYAVVLDADGRFLKVANRHYTVGQTVTDVVQMQHPSVKRPRRWLYSLAAVAACLALILGIALPGAQQPYGSVYIKINPEVRIDVDKNDMVVGLEGVNQDGADLIRDYDFTKKDLDAVTDELVDKAIEMGYLHTDGQITICLDSQDQLWVEHHCQSLSHHLQERLGVTVQIQPHHTESHEGHGGSETAPTYAGTEPQPSGTQEEKAAGHSGHGNHDGHD